MSTVINDVAPRTQAIATNLQTVFDVTWTADVASDVTVYARADGVAADDVAQILTNVTDYTVTFVGALRDVRVTLVVGRTTLDIVTISRETPTDRQNLYTNTNFTPSMLNQDFEIDALSRQQNKLFRDEIGPKYNVSESLGTENQGTHPNATATTDSILPKLDDNQAWVMNSDSSAISVKTMPTGGIAPDDATYVTLTPNSGLSAEFPMSAQAVGFMANDTGGVTILPRTLTGTATEIGVTNGTGVGGNPVFGIVDNPAMPGTAGMQLPTGTTAQRVTPISPAINLRYNTTNQVVEFYDHAIPAWVDVESASAGGSNFEIQWNDAGILNGDSGFITDGAGNVELTGTLLTTTTASEDDTQGVEIICDAAGFSDVRGLDIDYITGAQAALTEESAIFINLDDTAAVGGEFFGMEVVVTPGATDVTAIRAGALVHPLEQLAGTFGNADTILNKAVDVTAALASGGAGAISAFVADNDTITIGDAATFEEFSVELATPASGSGIAATFEFSTGVGMWTSFSPSDGTNNMKNTGTVVWDAATVTGWLVGTGSEYLIRITRTRNSLSTTPILDEIQIAAVVEYGWDKDAYLTLQQGVLDADPSLALEIATKQYVDAASSTLTTKGDLLTYSTVNARLAVGSTNGQTVQVSSGSATGLAWSTPTYPSTSGSAGLILRSNATNNVYSTSTFADTYAASTLLYSNTANTVEGLATANSAALVTDSSGVPAWTGSLTNGQVIIGSTGATPVAATITGGAGITVTNGGGTISISGAGGGFTWNEETGTSATMVVNNGYIPNNAGLVTLTLPAAASIGDTVIIQGKGAGLFKIAQNAGQTVNFGSNATTTGVGGSIASTQDFDSLEILCITANTDWAVLTGSQGVLTVV